MKKLLILSGKGGTGKTTTAAAFIRFSKARALADCDVDAPNLHLVAGVQGEPDRTPFIGSERAEIDPLRCCGCGTCADACRFNAIEAGDHGFEVRDYACEGCGVCTYVCPCRAVSMRERVTGELRLYGGGCTFSTAELKMGCGNSGKLVSAVKQAMEKRAPDAELAIIDGSPGIGCPVIASVSGVDLVLVVAEPSLSGLSDLQRLVKTAEGFETPLAVCVNKWTSSPAQSAAIELFCQERGLPFVGKIPYDKGASAAINAGKSLADLEGPASVALHEVFERTMTLLEGCG